AHSDLALLEAAQRMLLRLGITSKLHADLRAAGESGQPARPQHELVISGENLITFRDLVGFADHGKAAELERAVVSSGRSRDPERFTATVVGVEEGGVEDVYDVQVPGVNAFDANGLHAHNCGEQPLP